MHPIKRVDYKASAEKDLEGLDRSVALRVIRKIDLTLLASDRPGIPLSGEFSGLFKLRVGDYRVIYVPISEGALVLRIGHRREVYRKGRP